MQQLCASLNKPREIKSPNVSPFFVKKSFIAQKISEIHRVTKNYKIVPLTNLP